MRYLVALLALIFTAGLALGALAVWRSVEARHVEAMASISAAELILESRQTPPATAHEGGGAWALLGILAVVSGGVVGAVYLLRGSADLTKQLRLMRRKPQRRPQRPYAPPVPRIQEVPSSAPQLGAGAQDGRYEEVR